MGEVRLGGQQASHHVGFRPARIQLRLDGEGGQLMVLPTSDDQNVSDAVG